MADDSRFPQKNSRRPNVLSKPESHRDLVVWQKAMDLTIEIYRLTVQFPHDETYRLVSQITRAAASVPANIAEGRGRASRKDFANFLAIAKGSLMETENPSYPCDSPRLPRSAGSKPNSESHH